MMAFSRQTNRKLALLASGYYVLLAITYVIEIAPKWRLLGYSIDFNPLSAILSLFLFAVFFFITPITNSFRQLMLILSVLVIYIPGSILLSFSRFNLVVAVLYISTFSILLYVSRLKMPVLRARYFPKSYYISAILLLQLVVLGLLSASLGLNKLNFDIYSIYEFRRDVAGEIGENLNRILSINTKLLLPLLAIYSLSLNGVKKYILLSTALAAAVLIYGFWQHKSAAFATFAVAALYFFLKKDNAAERLVFSFFLLGCVLASEALWWHVWDYSLPGPINGILGRRAFFSPALLTQYYIDFFSRNEFVLWYPYMQHFGAMIAPYDVPTASLMASVFFDSDEGSSNVGFIGSGYANAGVIGVLFYAILIGLLISFVNAQSKRLGSIFAFCLTVFVFHTALASSDLPVALRSHGLLFSIILIVFLRPTSSQGNEDK